MRTDPAVIEDRRGSATADLESTFGEILSGLLQVGSVPVESHFFDDLGADSLVMAHFCARVRKLGNLPSVSMKDVYAHPTIRGLATALDDSLPGPPRPTPSTPAAAPTPTSQAEYLLCGALQALFFLAYSAAGVRAIGAGYAWVTAAADAIGMYLRLVVAVDVAFLSASALPIAAKWVLVGRWEPRQIRLWSLDYFRFWIVKSLVRSSPALRLFVGTPIFTFYLRALGAKIGRGVVIFSRRIPVCTDLLTIGEGTVIRRDALFSCYMAHSGRIETGPVTIGRNAFVGERSVLDIQTSMGDGAQLGHVSALHIGQSVPAGERWHGSPAERTEVNYLRVPPVPCGTLRRAVYSASSLLFVMLLSLPLSWVATSLSIGAASSLTASLTSGTGAVATLVIEGAILSLLFFFGFSLAGLLIVIAVPRALNRFIEPDRVYPLYGVHDLAVRAMARLGGLQFFTTLFGDSNFIVNFLQWLGFHLSPVVQTGSNFGTKVAHVNPSLCAVGSGTMVADGIILANDDVSNTSFRLARTVIGPHNFVGNDVTYPAGGRTGDNVLLATKVMVPLEGRIREGVGLLGSPSFEIPRTVDRDSQFDHLRTGESLRRCLAAKKRYNLRTIGVFLFTRWLGVFLFAVTCSAAFEPREALPSFLSVFFLPLGVVLSAVYFCLADRIIEAAHPVRPTICSIYHADFWSVERLWKVHPVHSIHLFDGTPFKNVLWMLLGVRIGKRIFDDGVHLTEPTLITLGNECVLNYRSTIQCHSQEDGTFKCDRTTIGADCTIGVGALAHYGVTMDQGSVLAADSFLMKGEYVPQQARWGGNPAREM
jgi:non-ribosomal peptide synthetase-like protein